MKPQHTRISAYALITRDDKLLLCRVSDQLPRWAGQWTLPGGGIDFGEDPKNAVVREVKEETNLEVTDCSIRYVDSITDDSGAHDFHGIRLIYDVVTEEGTLCDEIGGTTDKVAWINKDDLTKLPLVGLAQVGVNLVFPNHLSTLQT